MKVEYSGQIFEKVFKYKISWKFFLWELTCCMRTDGHADMTKLIVGFRNFAYATRNWAFLLHCLRVSYLPHSQQWLLPWYDLYRPLSSALVSSKSTLLCSEDVYWFPSSFFPLIFRTNIYIYIYIYISYVLSSCTLWIAFGWRLSWLRLFVFCFLVSTRKLAWFYKKEFPIFSPSVFVVFFMS